MLAIYYIIYFICVLAVFNVRAVYVPGHSDINYTDPGFSNVTVASNISKCTGFAPSSIRRCNIFCIGGVYIPCYIPDALNEDNLSCQAFPGCTWDNSTSTCLGYINGSIINLTSESSVCESGYMQTDQWTCEALNCTWVRPGQLYVPSKVTLQTALDMLDPLLQTFKFIFGIHTDLGFQTQLMALIWALFFTYLPALLALLATYGILPIPFIS